MNLDWNNPYPTIRSPLMARNVVATSQALAPTHTAGSQLRAR